MPDALDHPNDGADDSAIGDVFMSDAGDKLTVALDPDDVLDDTLDAVQQKAEASAAA